MVENLASGVQAFTSNAFLVSGDRTVLVDPGANFDVVSRLRERDVDLDAVLVTHPHPDHVGNLEAVLDAFDVDAWGFDASDDDVRKTPKTSSAAHQNASLFEDVDHELADGDTVTIGDHDYDVVHTPGHEPHHLCFYARGPGVLFSADLVFANGSFGRTDLPGGDRQTLVESIERVADLVDASLDVIYPGHGPSVTTDPVGNIERAAQAARFG